MVSSNSYTRRVTEDVGRRGRPRSERARTAVLNAVDDLLVEVGYAAMTMKSIAERAGVSRQTVYRWWSTKAEILLEASAADAEEELAVEPASSPLGELNAYLGALARFLSRSPAGAAYRALLGEAQHDNEVAALLERNDFLLDSARTVLSRVVDPNRLALGADQAAALLVGPTFFWVLSGHDADELDTEQLAATFLDLVAAHVTPS